MASLVHKVWKAFIVWLVKLPFVGLIATYLINVQGRPSCTSF